jgi:hypothetical protein
LINDLIGVVGWTKKDESPKHCWKNINSIKVYRNCNYTYNNGETQNTELCAAGGGRAKKLERSRDPIIFCGKHRERERETYGEFMVKQTTNHD